MSWTAMMDDTALYAELEPRNLRYQYASGEFSDRSLS
jgi:hypothetical protein